ncbi:MAG: hypothetical protein ACK2UC_07030 [Anaerolineae bacterium]|jgi:hypothetical protein
MLNIAKVALPLLGVVVVAGILVLALGSGAGKGSDREAVLKNPAAPEAGIPPIDANAPAETRTATFALG